MIAKRAYFADFGRLQRLVPYLLILVGIAIE
jgi:hypothetical protein